MDASSMHPSDVDTYKTIFHVHERADTILEFCHKSVLLNVPSHLVSMIPSPSKHHDMLFYGVQLTHLCVFFLLELLCTTRGVWLHRGVSDNTSPFSSL